jgi:hypothetical protein
MDQLAAENWALIPGQRVRAEVVSHHPWGVGARILGHEPVVGSVDMIQLFARTTPDHDELLAMFPPIGTEIDAVVQRVDRWRGPGQVRLSIRPADLESFRWICDFCGQQTVLSTGGDGLVLDSRSNDGPGSHTIISHRRCLADRIRPENPGERARALETGRDA